MTFRCEVLAAGEGDCLWIEYGENSRLHRVIVDGAPAHLYTKTLRRRIEQLPVDDRTFELLIVTHIDGDHIGGAVRLLEDAASLGVRFNEIWFNGFHHLLPSEPPTTSPAKRPILGPLDGERLSEAMRPFRGTWNRRFGGGAVAVSSTASLPRVPFEGGLDVTLLSPTNAQLVALRPKWEAVVRAAGLVPGGGSLGMEGERPMLGKRKPLDPRHEDLIALARRRSREDTAEANGSSIAVALEFDGRRIVLGADAHPRVLAAGLARAASDIGAVDGRLPVDVFKLPHHGSKSNVTEDLLRCVRCAHYVVSTSGAYHEHPDPEALARVVVEGGTAPTIHFNYESVQTRPWLDADLQTRYKFRARAASARKPGISLELI